MPLAPQVPNNPVDVTKYATITSRSATGTQVRYFIDADPGFAAGDVVAISGFASDAASNAYNGTYTIVSVGSNPPSFLVNSTANGAITLTTDYPQVVSLGASGSEDYEYSDVNPVYLVDTEDLASNNPILSSSTPVGKFDGQLWFDSGNGNILKRWDAASQTWVTVRDNGIPTALANAQTAINNANTAIANAAAANAAATSAAYQAGVAQSTADGKNKVNYSTSTPSGGGTNGDIWFRVDAGTGAVLNQYVYNGSSWVERQISNTVIANLDAGKITAGTISGIAYNNGSGTFSVSPSGVLVASQATITGTVTATSGTFTGTVYASAGTFTGAITGGSIQGTTITNGTNFNVTSSGTLTAATGTIGGFTIGSTSFGDGTNYISTSGQASFDLYIARGTGTALSFSNGGNISGAGNISASTLSISSTSTFSGTITANGDVNLGSTQELRVPYGYSQTVGNAANVFITSTGQLRRSTASSIRFKKDVVDLVTVADLDPRALLNLRVRAFKFKSDALPDTDDRADKLIPGFIAEEVAEIYPIAADRENGQPQNWNERIVIPGLLALIQDQEKRIKALEEGGR